MAQTKVKLVSNGVITVDNLHTNHGITTDHIGEGTNKFFTDARVQSYLTSNNYAKTTDVASLETTTSLSLSASTLSYVDESGTTTNIDLSSLGYLTSFTETDPIYIASSWYTTTNNAANWDTAYSWGNHATQSYATQTYVNTAVANLVDTAPTTLDTLNELAAALGDDPNFATTVSTSIGTKWTQDNTKISNWDTAYSWGNHASAGYLTSLPSHTHDDRYYTESESISLFARRDTSTNINGNLVLGNTAYGQGTAFGSSGSRLFFSGSDTDAQGNYYIGTNHEDYGGNYSKLDLRWHTGIRMGAQSIYGGIRFYDSEDLGTEIFAIGKSGNFAQAANSLRAPIFYDSNDTSYYVDPNSASNIRHLRINGNWGDHGAPYTGQFTIRGTYPSIQLRSTTSNSMWLRHMDGAGDIQHYFASGVDSESWAIKHTMKTNGTFESRGDSRAPIFYDYNDTNYYIDPNSTSRTNVLTSFSLRNNYDVSVNHTYGVYFSNAGGESYSIFRESGAWSHPYPDLRIAFHTGIKLGAYYGYNGIRFYNNSDMVTQTASIGDGDNNLRGYYDIIAYASDKRLKEKIEPITDAINKVKKLNGFTYNWNSVGEEYGWEPPKERESGVFAQEVQEVLPEAVRTAPFDQAHDEDGNMHSKSGENFLTVKYEKLVPLLIEAIKEQQQQIEELKQLINK